jgi:uncharacterized protein (TIGR00251 family)
VSPGAKQDEIVGWQGDVLRVRVRAAPEKGKANEAVRALIAAALEVPPSSVTLKRGASSRDKVLEIQGFDEDEVRRRLGAPLL